MPRQGRPAPRTAPIGSDPSPGPSPVEYVSLRTAGGTVEVPVQVVCWLCAVEDRGITLTREGDQLWAEPGRGLTDADRAMLLRYRNLAWVLAPTQQDRDEAEAEAVRLGLRPRT